MFGAASETRAVFVRKIKIFLLVSGRVVRVSAARRFLSGTDNSCLFSQSGLRPLWNPRRAAAAGRFFIRGTYHPFLGKDVTLHIYSSEGEICAAAFGSPGERKTTFAPVTICSELVTHDAR